MNKPTKPNITIPEAFAVDGIKTDFTADKLQNGFDRIQPDVLAGDNLNKLIDDTYKGLNYAMAGTDAINLIQEDEVLTVKNGELVSRQSSSANITTYHNVVYGVDKTVAFGGDYSSFAPVDISSYADGIYYVYKVDTTNEETQEVTSSISITTTASETATEIAKIKIAGGTLTEVLTSLQYTTETPLQEVKEHTESSAKDIDYNETGKLNLVPFNFSKVNWSDNKTVNANTVSTYTKDGVFFANSIAKVTYTDGGIAIDITTNIIPVTAGDSIKSTVAGKIFFYY